MTGGRGPPPKSGGKIAMSRCYEVVRGFAKGEGPGVRALVGLALAGLLVAGLAQQSRAEWFHEDFTVHGFFTSKAYFRSPNLDFGENTQLSSWRNELNLEMEMGLYRGENVEIGLVGIVRPIYDAVYDIHPNTWGDRVKNGDFGSGTAFSAESNAGESCPLCGAVIDDEYTVVNNDTGTLFTGKDTPVLFEDQIVFYGGVPNPVAPRGSRQPKVGMATPAAEFQFAADRTAAAGDPSLQNTLDATATGVGGANALHTPLNFYAGALGSDRSSLKQSPADLNRTSSELQFDCEDGAHPWCFLREFYADIEIGRRTFIRLGKQQIVWGKTDAFRLQDVINPLDLGYHNVFPDLEERRIPQFALRVIQSFGNVGPLQDMNLEFVWNFDEFIPTQIGQCGEPYAFTASCHLRGDVNGHTLLNVGTAEVKERDWQPFANGEVGLRLEFRIPQPSMAMSLSAYWGFQDTPVARFSNFYNARTNPNPAAMAFLQGLGLSTTIDSFAQMSGRSLPGNPAGSSSGAWVNGFDLLDRSGLDGSLGAGSGAGLAAANQDLIKAWDHVANGICAGTAGAAKAQCISDSGLQILNFPWSGSEDALEFPRVLTIGGSLDYQIPGADTVLRVEAAYDVGRQINNTDELDMVTETDVIKASIGIDRPTFIPFLSTNRTAFLSFQTFVEHVTDYDDGAGNGFGMIVPETQLVSTFFMQNFWRNDSIILTNFVAFDWDAQAWITGPSLRWVMNQNVFFDIGANLIWGKPDTHNLSNLCGIGSQSLGCVGDPTTWQSGQWQGINQDFAFKSETPWWKESFADKFMEKRDEVWVGFTYQF